MLALPLSAVANDRLVKLAGLFGSDHEGERATAARMATDLLRQHGLTWRDVLSVPAARSFSTPAWKWREPITWRDAISVCLHHERLSAKEQDFLDSLLDYRVPSEKQLKWLSDIVDKIRAYAGAPAPVNSTAWHPRAEPPPPPRPQAEPKAKARKPKTRRKAKASPVDA